MKEEGESPDVLTFAGNGEPTGHPQFEEIIEDTVRLRNSYFPKARISVLSNSTFIHREQVRRALMKVDNNILKLDTVDPEYIAMTDRPTSKNYDVRKIIEGMKLFNGHVIIQTMFMKGTDDNGNNVDNTGDKYAEPWLKAVKEIEPMEVMIYTIDRETPEHGLQKASKEEMEAIRRRVEKLGIECTASY